jgi:hypothetical protein
MIQENPSSNDSSIEKDLFKQPRSDELHKEYKDVSNIDQKYLFI